MIVAVREQTAKEVPQSEWLRVAMWAYLKRVPSSWRRHARGYRSISDVMQDVAVKLLSMKRRGKVLTTTYIVNAVRWTLCEYTSRFGKSNVMCERSVKMSDAVVEPDADIERDDRQMAIEWLLRSLTYQRRLVIEMRYGLGDGMCYTLAEVAKVFRLTKERIRQIETRAIRELQYPSRANRFAKKVFMQSPA